jgi:hypothetical protein
VTLPTNNPFLKKAYTPIEFTPHQIEELIKCQADPEYFLRNYYTLKTADGEEKLFEPYPYQLRFLRAMVDDRFVIGKIGRQLGKSSIVIAFLLHSILFFPNREILLLSKSEIDAIALLSRIKYAYEKIPQWMQQGVLRNDAKRFELENKSSIQVRATTEGAGRSGSYWCVFADEFAFVPANLAHEFYTAAYPTVSSGKQSKFIIVSCVTKNSYVFTPHGPRRISEFIDNNQIVNPNLGYKVLPYAVAGKDKLHQGDIMVNSGVSKTYKIKSQCSDLECSPAHKLWVCDKNGHYGWKKAEDVQVGEWIGLRYGLNLWGNYDSIKDLQRTLSFKEHSRFEVPLSLNEDLAYFLGLFLAEGYARPIYGVGGDLTGGQVTITCGDDIAHVFEKLGLKYSKSDDVHYTVNSKSLFLFLKEFGFDPALKAKNKVVPDRLFMCSEKVICSFLRGYFDGDGTITQGQYGIIGACSASSVLIDQIRILLMNLGILSGRTYYKTTQTKKVKAWSERHVLEISMCEQRKLFMEKVGFGLKRKADKYSYNPLKKLVTKDYIPFGRRYFQIEENKTYDRSENISRARAIAAGVCHEIVDPNIKWDVVRKIETGENEVFDFSLPHVEDDPWCHSVLYNGYIGHQTPNGINLFYKLWMDAKAKKNNYTTVEAHWSEHPDRDEKWARQEEKALGSEKFAQEYLAEFLGSADTLISSSKLRMLVHSDPIFEQQNYQLWDMPKLNHKYVICSDIAEGIGRDYTVAVIIDVTSLPYQYVGKYRSNRISPLSLPKLLYSLGKQFNEAHVLVETGAACQGIGEQVGNTLYFELEYENVFCSTKGVGRGGQELEWTPGKTRNMGVRTTRATKAKGCASLKHLVENDQLIIPDFEAHEELSNFKKIGNTFRAEDTLTDDIAMSLVIFGWLCKQTNFEDLTETKVIAHDEGDLILPLVYDGLNDPGDVIVDTENNLLWQRKVNFIAGIGY